jgi:hypothetical protein
MPFGDGTGPRGMGPMTGWGAGYGRPGLANTMPGRGWSGFGLGFGPGFGRGLSRGRGRGMGRRWFSPYRYYPRW